MLILSRKVDEKICIGSNIVLTVIEMKGDQVKIGVEAPREVKVFRKEIVNSIQEENKEASHALEDKTALSNLGKLIQGA